MQRAHRSDAGYGVLSAESCAPPGGNPKRQIQHVPVEVLVPLLKYVQSPNSDPAEALALYLTIFHLFATWELQNTKYPKKSEQCGEADLSELYGLTAPTRPVSLGRHSAGREILDFTFPESARPWLPQLLARFGIKKFCSEEHRILFVREEVLGPTGCFRPLIEEYMQIDAKSHYKPKTLPTVQTSVSKFFRFAVRIGITDVKEVRPNTISQFIVHESERGRIRRTYIGHLSTFFNWLIDEERYDRPNPVIPRRHYSYDGLPDPRPYNDHELQTIWEIVEARGKLELMLAFSIGQECGLRVGEVANIRIKDVDRTAQTIFVRLPTKNDRTRTVPFHEKVAKYIELWLAQRDPHCHTDHLLHNLALNPYSQDSLDAWFKKLLRDHPEPAASFVFHRLRHTWATRLMNGGMELAALKELGGWVSWSSMQRYVKVLDSTVQRQYETAYRNMQLAPDPGDEEEFSLLDFALMKGPDAAVPADSAA